MPAHLRIARPVTDLEASVAMYESGVGLAVIGSFQDHDGFDGTMLGTVGENYHFEFTSCRTHPVQPTPTNEDLLVLYLPEAEASQQRCMNLLAAGFREVDSFNPYWASVGAGANMLSFGRFQNADGFASALA